jgi:hypothetical protein
MASLSKEEIWAKVTNPDYIDDDFIPNDPDSARLCPYPYLYETETPEQAAALEELIQGLESWYNRILKPKNKQLPIEAVLFGIEGLEIGNPKFQGTGDTDTRECVLDELKCRGVDAEPFG